MSKKESAPRVAGRILSGSEEVVAWEFATGYTSTRQLLATALEREGWDGELAGPLAPRHAFARVIRSMAKGKLVRIKRSEADLIEFQITNEMVTPEWLTYDPEAKYALWIKTGDVDGTDAQVVDWIVSQLEDALEQRTAADVNRMLQRLL